MVSCRLCAHQARGFMTVDGVDYLACDHCGLRFMDAAYLPSPADEKSHYDQHENEVDDPRYRRFLSRLSEPLMQVLPQGSTVLDFGSGPGPALAKMMQENGHYVSIYDPFYAPDLAVLNRQYDAVTASEVIEHFHQPKTGFQQMLSCVKAGGWLAVMTQVQNDDQAFAEWHYRRDPTHVAFYRAESFDYIAAAYGLELQRPSSQVALFRCHSSPPQAYY